jgi:hypothetical protein
MKRIMMGMTLLVCLGVLTGCGSKKLTCTATGTDIGKKVVTTIDVSFNGSKASKVKTNIEMNFENVYEEALDVLHTTLKEEYSKQNKEEGMKVDVTKGDNKIVVNIDMDVKKYSKSNGENDIVDITQSRAEIKKALEQEGYICK